VRCEARKHRGKKKQKERVSKKETKKPTKPWLGETSERGKGPIITNKQQESSKGWDLFIST